MEGDDRFRGIATDPRFRTLPSRLKKVKIDDRFKSMFKDKKFKVKSSIDERLVNRNPILSLSSHSMRMVQSIACWVYSETRVDTFIY